VKCCTLALVFLMAGCSVQNTPKSSDNRLNRRKYFVQIATNPNKLIEWTPRVQDIPRRQTPEREDFLFVLKTAVNTVYTVKRGDSLDRIIRTQLFVSGIQEPRAYTEYKREIQGRNHDKPLRNIQPDDKLFLPSGPHYAALESIVDTRQEYLQRLGEVLNREHCKRDQRTGDCSTIRQPSSTASGTLSSTLAFRIFQSLGHFTRAYPSPDENVTITRWRRKSAVDELVTLRVLPPIDLRPGIDQELVGVYIPPSLEIPSGLWTSSSPEELPRFADPTRDPVDDCPTPANCNNCSKLLGAPPITTPLRGKLLLADTGVDSDLLSPQGAYYAPLKNPPAQQSTGSSPQPVATPQDVPQANTPTSLLDFSDPSSDHHGTFVYGELVNKGILPADNVRFARVAARVDPPFDYVISVRHIAAAMSNFVKDNIQAQGSPVWVASFSFGGDVKDAEQAALGVSETSHMLYVVAAGNLEDDSSQSGADSAKRNKQRLIGDNYVYAKFNGPLRNILVVGALNSKDKLATYGKIRKNVVDLFARGSCVCGGHGQSDHDQEQLYGTSQAAPIAATAALILADRHPSWTPQQLKWRLISTTDFQSDLYDAGIGGKLNLSVALNYRSILTRTPLSTTDAINKKGSVTDKLKAFVSNTQIQISVPDTSNGGWGKLLTSQTQVLRLHRVTDSCDKGQSCFRRIVFEGGEADQVNVSDATPLPYKDEAGNIVGGLQAKDLIDAVFTFVE
jgi:hypothetical protein